MAMPLSPQPDPPPSLVVRDIPPPLYHRLHERAVLHRRSVNAEMLSILEGALGPRRLTAGEILSGVARLLGEPAPRDASASGGGRR